MKFLDAITHRILGRKAALPPLTEYKETSKIPDMWHEPKNISVIFEVLLRAEMSGPINELPELRKRAARMFAHEIYGDVLSELRELRRELWVEGHYRADDDPVLTRFAALENKLKGLM